MWGKARLCWILALGLVGFLTLGSTSARELTFGDRVKAQEAIERVYWEHRIWPSTNPSTKPSFEESMPRQLVRRRSSTSSARPTRWMFCGATRSERPSSRPRSTGWPLARATPAC